MHSIVSSSQPGPAAVQQPQHAVPSPWARVIGKVKSIRAEQGVAALAWRLVFSAYRRTVRNALPDAEYVLFGGIAVGRRRKIGERMLPERLLPPDLQDHPIYEFSLIKGLQATIRPGDRIIVIGGGEGITATWAALLTGETGSVVCYEGDRAGIDATMRTAAANGVADRITCVFAVVGQDIGVFGTDVAETIVHPSDLPACDVLEMDCEGSEVQILREMSRLPRAVIVETHGFAGAPTAGTMSILHERGYAVTDLGLAEPKPSCIGRDEHVVQAELRS